MKLHVRPILKLYAGITVGIALSLGSMMPGWGQALFRLHGRGSVHPGVTQSRVLGHMAESSQLDLAISLPVEDQSALDSAVQQIYDPQSPNYRQYLTPSEFNDTFGPTEAQYDAVIDYLKSRGFTVTSTYDNRMVVDVAGSVSNVEQTFHVNMLIYQHPTENRTFFGPDSEPTLDKDLPILDISGLDNFVLPQSFVKPMPAVTKSFQEGSGSGGTYVGYDFREAYAPEVTLDGTGQTIGLFQLGGYYAADINAYDSQFGLPAANITQVLLDGAPSTPPAGSDTIEQALDLEMVHSMAPGANIYFYNGTSATDVWNRIASDDIAKSISSSWAVSPPPSTMTQILEQMATQGQSVFQAAGDSGFQSSPFGWGDNPYITCVGGTNLSTASAGGAWTSDTGWSGSGGYISPTYAIPSWQQGINMSASGGSTTMRNCPDVAMTATDIWDIYSNGTAGGVQGTSCAAPLWAGFLALVDQQANSRGLATAGFINPAVYALGKGPAYNANFNDVTSGNNGKPCVQGYDLVTGWGTPTGQTLIDSLSGAADDPPFFNIINDYSGLAIDLIGDNTVNGADTNLWTPAVTSTNQRWAFVPVDNGAAYKIVSWDTGKVLSVANDSSALGTQIWDWDYTGSDAHQWWTLSDAGNGWFTIQNVATGLVLDDDGYGTTNGTELDEWSNNFTNGGGANPANQMWRLQPYGTYYIRAASGRYICCQGGQAAGALNGAAIIQYDYQVQPWFQWNFVNEGAGWFSLFNVNSPTRVISVDNDSTADAADTQLWSYNPSDTTGSQQVRIEPQLDGEFKFYFEGDGMSWDMPGGATGDNVPLQQYPNNGNSWQQFWMQTVPATNVLYQPSFLAGGQELVNGAHTLAMQTDGNLVEFDGTTSIWTSGTSGNPGAYCTMQSDGNFVVYNSAGGALWASGTSGNPGAYVTLQIDGNVVVYSSGNSALWATGTEGK